MEHRVVVALGLVALALLAFERPKLVSVVASNGSSYFVRPGAMATIVADRLGDLDDTLRAFLAAAARAYPRDERIAQVYARWDGELAEVQGPEAAYSVEKTSVHVCVRQTATTLEPMNNSVFVALHEFAHLCTSEVGHTPLFWENFQFLLEAAEALGFYTYDPLGGDATYCSAPMGQSPLNCVKSKRCDSRLPARGR